MPRQSPPIWARADGKERPRRLSRDEIVRAAIELADADGPHALTMKAVAARLGPYTPMALYRYVHSKDGLVDLMLDAAIATVAPPPAPGPEWRADLQTIAWTTRRMIKSHPWYAWLVHTRPPAGPHTMRRTEFQLQVLVGQGLAVDQAMTYAALLDRHVFGSGLQESQEAAFNASEGLDNAEQLAAAFASVHELAAADGHLPLLTSWLARPQPSTVDDQFELGLAFILDGIASRLPVSTVER